MFTTSEVQFIYKLKNISYIYITYVRNSKEVKLEHSYKIKRSKTSLVCNQKHV